MINFKKGGVVAEIGNGRRERLRKEIGEMTRNEVNGCVNSM